MRLASPLVGSLILILLVAIPVGGTPALQKGSSATYDLKVQISFAPPFCEASPTGGVQTLIIACPLIEAFPLETNITGTLGWSITNLTSTTAVLNVTKDVTISHDGLMIPDLHTTSNFNESVDLATRIISIMPFMTTEMNDALQMDQATATTSLPAGMDTNAAMTTAESSFIQPRPVYTMWWMNETLHQGQNVTVLVFPTKVVGAGSFEFQGSTRSTWDLVLNRTLPSPQPESMSMAPGVIGNGLGTVFSFEYDQTSGLLLSATADMHIGFIQPILQPAQCASSTIVSPTTCSASSSTTIATEVCGFSVHASLTLASTSLNLDDKMGSSGSTQTGGITSGGSTGSSAGSGSGGGTGSGSNSGSGGSGSPGGSNGGSSGGNNGGPGGGTTSGGGGTNGGSTPGTNSGGTPSLSSSQPSSGPAPWIYLLLAAVIVAIVAAVLLVARRRSKKTPSQGPVSQTS